VSDFYFESWLTNSQPVAVDVDGRFVFAAGEDHRVRVWSVDTGQLLPAHPSTQWEESGPFGHSFDDPVAALHVDSSGARLRLRLAVGREILQYGL
jgi:WD repeat-containing protein 21A